MSNINRIITFSLFISILIILSVFIATLSVLINKEEYPIMVNILSNIWPAIICSGLTGVIYNELSKHHHEKRIQYLVEKEKSGFQRIYESTEDQDFLHLLEETIPKSKKIIIYSAGLNMFWGPRLKGKLINQIKNDSCIVKIIMANPDTKNSPLTTRFDEEKESQHYSSSTLESIKILYENLKELEKDKSLILLKFDHYPTMSIINLDNDFFIYHYGHQTVGTISPVIHLKGNHSKQAKYYIKQLRKIENSINEDN